jgi:hypothetical protein
MITTIERPTALSHDGLEAVGHSRQVTNRYAACSNITVCSHNVLTS